MNPSIQDRTWIVVVKDVSGQTVEREVFAPGLDSPIVAAHHFARQAAQRIDSGYVRVFLRDYPSTGTQFYPERAEARHPRQAPAC